jgi:hypothetical protein
MAAWISLLLALQDMEEAEPNDSAEAATVLPQKRSVKGRVTGSVEDQDWYRVSIRSPGVYRLLVRPLEPDARPILEARVQVWTRSDSTAELYAYLITDYAAAFQFFPVLDPGDHFVQVGFLNGAAAGRGYEISLEPAADVPADDEVKRAREAIVRGVEWLLAKGPEWKSQGHFVASSSLALAALSEGADAPSRLPRIDRDYVEPLDKLFEEWEGTWKGRRVYGVWDTMYAHAMATLGLAEAAVAGSDKARAAARRAAEFLLAAQQSEEKCAAWGGPIGPSEHNYGGWRYKPDSTDADLSVTGWCVVGLAAVGAAGIQIEGLRDALDRAVKFAERVSSASGFSYEHSGGTTGNLRNSVGALVCLLWGHESAALDSACLDLDRHLPAWTQVDVGENYPLYYAYYATRGNYLRGGRAWERWRSAMIRQLLFHRRTDGSWPVPADNESVLGDRWATALGVLILRLCLNEPPAYLKLELKGF